MKKIISTALLILFFCSNVSFAVECSVCFQNCLNTPGCQAACTNNGCTQTPTPPVNPPAWWWWGECPWSPGCPWYEATMNSINTWSPTSVMGITCDEKSLVNGQCKLNIYDTLGIRQSIRNTWDQTSVGQFVQDVVLSATMFIGTLVTIALIASGLMFIFAASSGKDPGKAKTGILWSLVGLLIVVSSYVIIRLVQYIAKGF